MFTVDVWVQSSYVCLSLSVQQESNDKQPFRLFEQRWTVFCCQYLSWDTFLPIEYGPWTKCVWGTNISSRIRSRTVFCCRYLSLGSYSIGIPSDRIRLPVFVPLDRIRLRVFIPGPYSACASRADCYRHRTVFGYRYLSPRPMRLDCKKAGPHDTITRDHAHVRANIRTQFSIRPATRHGPVF